MKTEDEIKELLKFERFLLKEKHTTEHDKITIIRIIATLEWVLEIETKGEKQS